MPSNRKFYKTVFKVTILSEHPFHSRSLHDMADAIDSGNDVGRVEDIEAIEINARQTSKELNEIGSYPGFFQLTETGDDEEE